MNTWRMAMRVGNQGTSLWPYFHEKGVAVITYYPVINYNLAEYSKSNRPEGWHNLKRSQKGSLDCVAYKMNVDDVIYVKEGSFIVSKGKVIGRYFYDNSGDVLDNNGEMWPHRVLVKWNDLFPRLHLQLGAEQITVLNLNQDRIDQIEQALSKSNWIDDGDISNTANSEIQQIYVEGKLFLEEQYFRKRNYDLIREKKNQSKYKCEVCSFKYFDMYGSIGEGYIEAHHKFMISNGERNSVASDIALLCANCHSMIHRKVPPYTIEELKEIVATNTEFGHEG